MVSGLTARGYFNGRPTPLRIALFVACYNDTLFPQTGIAVTELLERLGHTVEFPLAQTCCGQMHYNTGYHGEAVPLVRRFVELFRDAETVCVPSASCVAMMREHYELIARNEDDPRLLAEVQALLPRVFEFSELLTKKLKVTDVGAHFPHSVTYHPSCHSLRMLNIREEPLTLLRAVDGLNLIELPNREQCCGFGGTFAVKNMDVSTAMLAEKKACVIETKADVVTSLDNSCLMNIWGGLHRDGSSVRTVHIAEILNSVKGLAGGNA
ncbi:(Fe-S)-binding protein [Bryocella elongata]|uniref:(Fe-S)-binding protein n=1 Tax=Bryocella elongata TaxID=863522 RepID=UPI002E0E8D76